MEETRKFLAQMGLPGRDAYDLPTSAQRFPDGAQYRVEIPSVEGPRALKAVIETAKKLGLQIDRVSQGSGIMLLTDEELREMAALGQQHQMEVSLFVGPRAGWDIGAQVTSPAGKILAGRLRGMDQLVYAVEDVKRACQLGIRGVLVADEGLLWVLDELKKAGHLPGNLVIKVSVQMGQANPAAIRMMELHGAGTYNIPTDLTLPQIAAIRQAITIPLDIYVEVPDGFGGFVRYYEIPEIVRVAAPVYLKFGLRNAPDIYPSGSHLEETAVKLTVERVRRAKMGLDMLKRYSPEAVSSKVGAEGLAIPEPSGG
ncbi:MAG: U32 family peptidase [candidate division NC10 bacterium]|nr:U32 family peptidase [candidate division NC10 bacterium]